MNCGSTRAGPSTRPVDIVEVPLRFAGLLLLIALAACGDKTLDTGDLAEADADTDADTDSDSDSDTDADTDSDTDPSEELDCDNGVDDDGDGLIDCEDGDCSDHEICGELICDDGLDGDDDGLTDCEDDDCLATCHPGGIRATVHSGRLYAERYQQLRGSASYSETWHGYCGLWRLDMDFELEQHLQLRSLSGTVRVLAEGWSEWSASAPTTTCAWTFPTGSVSNRFGGWGWDTWLNHVTSLVAPSYPYYSRESWVQVGTVERDSVTIEGDCRIGGSWFLPGQLLVADRGEVWELDRADIVLSSIGRSDLVLELGALWYAGEVLESASTVSSSFRGGHSRFRWGFTQTRSEEVTLQQPPVARGGDSLTGLELQCVEVHHADPGGTDLDGDGASDLIVSDFYGQKVLLFQGPMEPDLAVDDAVANIDFSHAPASYPGALEGTADLDGDGIQDLALVMEDWGGSGDPSLYLFLGADDGSWSGTLTHEDAWSTVHFEIDDWRCDPVLSSGPDLSGNGLGELALTQTDTVYLLPPATPGTHAIEDLAVVSIDTASAGWEEAALDFLDSDGDGLTELVVGAWETDEDSGTVALFRAPLTGTLAFQDADVLISGGAGSCAGATLAGVGDVDADGLEDLLFSAATDDAGALLFTELRTAELTLDGATARIGSPFPGAPFLSVAEAGDLDGDGHAELLLREEYSDYDTVWMWSRLENSTAWLIRGPVEGVVDADQAERRWLETASVIDASAVGDLNGDGMGDLLFLLNGWGHRNPALWISDL